MLLGASQMALASLQATSLQVGLGSVLSWHTRTEQSGLTAQNPKPSPDLSYCCTQVRQLCSLCTNKHQQSAVHLTDAQEHHLDAIIHVLRVEVKVPRSLPHVRLGHVGCVQQLVAVSEVVLLQPHTHCH